MHLYVCGDSNRSSRYTTVPHAEVGAPENRWTVYINRHHTDYVPLGHDATDRADRALRLAAEFGLKPIRREKPAEGRAEPYMLCMVRVPKTRLDQAPAWDGTFIEQRS